MRSKDSTSLGGPERIMRTTIWSDILAAGNRADPGSKQKLNDLCRTYWKPVYAYIRAAWNKPVDEAKDLTQAFFARFLEKDYLAHLKPEHGSFRGYLKRALKNFLINAKEAERSRRAAFSLDAAPEEWERLGSDAETPDKAFDRAWFHGLLDDSIRELREVLTREDKAAYFDVFQAYCLEAPSILDEGSTVSYAEVARKLNLQETDVRNYLSYCRRTLKRLVSDRIREYATGDDDVERELREAAGA